MKNIFVLFLVAYCLNNVYAQALNPLWMRYPAISPDGTEIAFSYKGDLWKVAVNGGKAIQLTSHSALDFMPVWSRDGKSIAFSSDRYGNFDVFIISSEGGEPLRLTFHSSDDYPSDFDRENNSVIFSSMRTDAALCSQFPSARMPELYAVPAIGGRVRQILSIPAESAKYNPKGNLIAFQDKKGYEDPWRKHHRSSIARDIWIYDKVNNIFSRATDFAGEDRDPVFSSDGEILYYLSEESGSFNIHSMEVKNPLTTKKQLSKFSKHPVRFLSVANNNTICFHYNGEIYTMIGGAEPQKVNIVINADQTLNERTIEKADKASEFDISPNGREVVYVYRGDVFVSSIEAGTTKRITNTAEQERSASFSPDGRTILYAGERNSSWNLYQSKLMNPDDKYFFNATLIKEETLLETPAETFQPAYAPNGKEIAFLEERTELRILNLEKKTIRTVLKKDRNYSYSDGDQYFQWSPDSKWILVEFLQPAQWIREVGLVDVKGGDEPINLSRSGYNEGSPKWMMDGKMITWFSNRDGMKNHGSWGAQMDVYAMFPTQKAFDRYLLNKEEYDLLVEAEKEKEKKDISEQDSMLKKSKKEKNGNQNTTVENIDSTTVIIEFDAIYDRKSRLTIHSSMLSDAVVDNKGEKLYYLAAFEKGYDLWETDLRTKETKILQKLASGPGRLQLDKKGENIFLLSSGIIHKIHLKDNKKSTLTLKGELELKAAAEMEYLYEHIWRQVTKKFYRTDLHNTDWDFYKKEYGKFLPHINNGYDFAEMSSELLGELNASHTGCRFRKSDPSDDNTASLAVFFDENRIVKGLPIKEIIKGSPLLKAGSKIKADVIVEKINGIEIEAEMNFWPLFNRQAGQFMLLSLFNPENAERWEETVKPISRSEELKLRYKHWVEKNRLAVEKLSGGKVGYVHLTGMDSESFKTVYEEVLGLNYKSEALIVDTRFNGGGWLHDDLATFLSGKEYLKIRPRNQDLGTEPMFKWSRPSVVLMSEGNYSDAHMFPYTYKALGIGKLVGMPVPGTATAVWWETLQNGMVFGIPQVGMVTNSGEYLENTELRPDIEVMNEFDKVLKGKDQQLEAAVKELLKQLEQK